MDFNPGVIRSALNLPDHSEYELFDELVSLELNDLAAEITGGSLRAWPTKEGISPSALTPMYRVLHRLTITNWSPSKHNSSVRPDKARFIVSLVQEKHLDIASYMFERICSAA